MPSGRWLSPRSPPAPKTLGLVLLRPAMAAGLPVAAHRGRHPRTHSLPEAVNVVSMTPRCSLASARSGSRVLAAPGRLMTPWLPPSVAYLPPSSSESSSKATCTACPWASPAAASRGNEFKRSWLRLVLTASPTKNSRSGDPLGAPAWRSRTPQPRTPLVISGRSFAARATPNLPQRVLIKTLPHSSRPCEASPSHAFSL